MYTVYFVFTCEKLIYQIPLGSTKAPIPKTAYYL